MGEERILHAHVRRNGAAEVTGQNDPAPGAGIATSRDYLTVRIEGRVESIDALRGIIVREQNGRAIRLDEVATVEDGTATGATPGRILRSGRDTVTVPTT